MQVNLMHTRNVVFTIYSITVFLLFYAALKALLGTPLRAEYYSHIACIPFISAYLVYAKRKTLPLSREYSPVAGTMIIMAGILIHAIRIHYAPHLTTNNALSLASLSAITCWVGGFALFFGFNAIRHAAAPLLFFLLMIPVPSSVMDKAVYLLQAGSCETVEGIFRLIGVPHIRDGFVFYLPTLSVEVAQQCSGIRSTLALLVTTALAAYLFLDKSWQRIILLLSVVPISIIKNGLRISVLSVMGVYLDKSILVDGWLHRSGGIVFFAAALLLMSAVLWLLRKTEKIPLSQGGESAYKLLRKCV